MSEESPVKRKAPSAVEKLERALGEAQTKLARARTEGSKAKLAGEVDDLTARLEQSRARAQRRVIPTGPNEFKGVMQTERNARNESVSAEMPGGVSASLGAPLPGSLGDGMTAEETRLENAITKGEEFLEACGPNEAVEGKIAAMREELAAIRRPKPASFPAGHIDYDKLAEAMVRAQAIFAPQRPAEVFKVRNPVAPTESQWHVAPGDSAPPERAPSVKFDDRGMPVAPEQTVGDPHLVRQGNNPVTRILAQLTYPKDKEQQVVAMVLANMAPSVDMADPNGTMFPPLQEQAVLEHMREYCLGLRPEKPKTYLTPKYTLKGPVEGQATA